MIKNFPLVSVLILNYNGREYLEQCLNSVLNTDYPNFEVILIDNASTDDSMELVKTRFEFNQKLRIIRYAKNLGYEGFNRAIREARGDYIIFLDNDTKVDPKWLKESVRVMECDPAIGVAQSALVYVHPDNRKLVLLGWFIDNYSIGYAIGGWEDGTLDDGLLNVRISRAKAGDVFAVTTAVAVKKTLLKRIEAFDPRFFIYAEDTDFCWRVWISGYRVVFIPSSIVYHVGAVSKRKPLQRKMLHILAFHSYKNHIAMLIKNYEPHNMVKYLPVYLCCYVFMATLYLLFKGKREWAMGNIKGTLWNLVNLKYVWTQHLKVQAHRKVSDEYIMKKLFLKPLFAHALRRRFGF